MILQPDYYGCSEQTISSVSSISPVLLCVSSLPVSANGWSELVGLVSSLVHASRLLSGRGESSELSLLVLSRHDPVDSWVVSDCFVRWVDENNFIEFVTGVLTNPVRAEYAHVGAFASNTFLSDRFMCSGLLDFAHATGVAWLSIDASLLHISFTAASANTNSIDDVSLLSLVSELAGLVWTRWTLALLDDIELSIFPGPDSEHKADKIGLLLSPDFFEVLVRSHLLY